MGFGWFGRKSAPADARPFVPAWLTCESAEEGFARSYSAQFDEVYRRNPVGQRAVRLVAGMLGGLTIDAIEGDARTVGLIQADGLLESIAANLLLHGNAYVQLIADDRDAPAELWPLRPERVSVVSDEKGWPVAYLYRAAGQAVRIDRKDALERQQLAHIKALNPRDDHYGMHHRFIRRDRGTHGSMKPFPRLAADPGRIATNPDFSPAKLEMALFAVPDEVSSEWAVVLAASTCAPGWNRRYVEIHHAGRVQTVPTPHRKSVLGRTTTVLGTGANASVVVALFDAEQWLTSCSDEDLELGDNLAALGTEIVQFGEATSLGGGRFRLTGLRRGRLGTQDAIASHQKDERFVLIELSALQPINLPSRVAGSPIRALANNGSVECALTLAGKT